MSREKEAVNLLKSTLQHQHKDVQKIKHVIELFKSKQDSKKAIKELEFSLPQNESEPEPTVGSDRLREIAEKTWKESNAAKRHLFQMADEFDRLTAENKELQTELDWWGNLTRDNNIGTKEVPSLHDYIVQLQAELKAGKELWTSTQKRRKELALENDRLQAELKAKEERIEQIEEALRRIDNWAKAYPIPVFPKPTKDNLKQAADVLKANGLSLDRISADNMRHVLEGVKDIVEQALKGE